MCVLLDYKPENYIEFYNSCIEQIKINNLFLDAPNPYDIMGECLNEFINAYECFPV